MNKFTFGVITYNHEKLIVECLESIKYQILNFGQDEQVSIIVSDDASNDDTVEIIKEWLSDNGDLFYKIILLVSKNNVGIVGNINKVYRNVETIRFKTISGDDIFSNKNIFNMKLKKNTMLISPVITLKGDKIEYDDMHMFRFFSALYHKDDLRRYYQEQIKYYFPVSSIGMAFSGDMIEEAFFRELQDYKWIDDLVVFNYLIRQNITILCDCNNYILYRDEVGITRNKNHEKRKAIEVDNDLIRKRIFRSNPLFANRIINPIRYWLWVKRKLESLNFFYVRKDIKKRYIELKQEKNVLEDYYKIIAYNSSKWMKEYIPKRV